MQLPTVLVVDDDDAVRRSLQRDLDRIGCTIHAADSASAAFEVLRKHPVEIVIADNLMPGMTGLQFLRVVRQQYPQTIRIMLTGAPTLEAAVEAINVDEVFRFIEKPWEIQDLKMAIILASRRRQEAAAP